MMRTLEGKSMILEKWHAKKLLRLSLFSHLNGEILISLLKQTQYRLLQHRRGTIIRRQDDPCSELLILIDGTLSGSMIDPEGKKVTVEFIEAPRLIAQAFLFASKPRYPVDIEALSEVVVLALPRKDVLNLFAKDQKILEGFLALVSNRAQFLSRRLMYLSSKTITEKLIIYIRELHRNQDSDRLNLPVSVTELSDLFAVTRPALSRVFKQLSDQGIIHRKGRTVRILDWKFFNV